jgi:hypothetical protein
MTNYGSTSEAGSAYPSGKPEFTQVLKFNPSVERNIDI